MRRKHIQEIIIELLAEKSPRNSAELLDETIKRLRQLGEERSEQTVYRHIRQLVEQKQIEKIEILQYNLPEEERLVVQSEISDCIKVIEKTKDSNILKSRFDEIQALIVNKPVSNYPEILTCIENNLTNPLVAKNIETYKLLVDIIINIYYNEQKIRDVFYFKVITQIKGNIAQKLLEVAKNSPEHLTSSLGILGKSGRPDVARLIFEEMARTPSKLFPATVNSNLFTFARALAELFPSQRKLINDLFDQMFSDKNNDRDIIAGALGLRQKMIQEIKSVKPHIS